MNVYIRAFLGIGDCIVGHFHDRKSARAIARLKAGFVSGRFDRIGVYPHQPHEEGYAGFNPAQLDIFAALGVPALDALGVRGWSDVRDLNAEDGPPLKLPQWAPSFAVPRRFVLFSQHAGHAERCLTDPGLYRTMKDATHLPIVKVGGPMPCRAGTDVPPIDCDLDLTGRTTLPQTFWLAERAACIVSPLSFFRTMTALYGTPVIELAECGRLTQKAVDRTNREYAKPEYGMGELNRWLTYPNEQETLTRLLKTCATSPRDELKTMWER